MSKPLCIDLYAGLGGWSEGFIAEGWDCIGFDIERHEYGAERYPGQLVLQNVLTLHGRQFKDAQMIVGSSPCQEFSYRAMPWKRAKALPPPHLGMELFHAQFRIQREACEAAGRHIPLVVENVRGAQKWVGRSRWNFGSFHLWGDVPALMPIPAKRAQKFNPDGTAHPPGSWFAIADSKNRGSASIKNSGGSWFAIDSPGQKVTGRNPVHEETRLQRELAERVAGSTEATKINLSGHAWYSKGLGSVSSSSSHRKRASAMIAKIPLALSRHIARTYYP